jgi:energy-coupling factor transporter ATP-binding protein EcfA2
MDAAASRGVEVIGLADHNSAEWLPAMVDAGQRAGIFVFPGLEITTGSGADGAHLIILSDKHKTKEDFDAILAGPCGFGGDHPAFQPNGNPAAAPRTLPQILDALPDDFLAIAPHAFNDNGIASEKTIEGDLRWKALHHHRLGAIDVGDASALQNAASFRARFIRRELDDFPCLPNLAFVSTSDSYSLDAVGSRTTWIRMAGPSLEGLRQAFLDHEARIVCDWDARYRETNLTPNDISHGWIESVAVSGLSTAEAELKVRFDPRLNVLIGGRGAGKSTVVAALRSLYGDSAGLPQQTGIEARKLMSDVFGEARVSGQNHLPYSGDTQRTHWTLADGPSTDRSGGTATRTSFKVRVVNQKELFERAANTADDPHMTSRNLLQLIDDALGAAGGGPGSASDFRAALDEAQTAWAAAARRHQAELDAVADRELVAQRVEEVRRQVAAFDDDVSRARRERNDQRLAEETWLNALESSLAADTALAADAITTSLASTDPSPPKVQAPADAQAHELADALAAIRASLRGALSERLSAAEDDLAAWRIQRDGSAWHGRLQEAITDTAAYSAELAALGIDANAYEQVRAQLAEQQALHASLESRAAQLPRLQAAVDEAWGAIDTLLTERREERTQLLVDVAERSQILRFSLQPAADETAWTRRVRDLLNLRADGFLEEVPALARWLWTEKEGEERYARLEMWRNACISGSFDALAAAAKLRATWSSRLSQLDPLVRARVAGEVPEDTVNMRFLRDGGDASREQDWQPLTAGSPGQRSAAMLSFVLHHGTEPLVLDQPEDDLDTEWITQLVVRQLRTSRWTRQLIVVTHNANIPVNADAERTIVLENAGRGITIRTSPPEGVGSNPHEHCGPLEDALVRADIQQIMEGGIDAFVRRERRYNNELNTYRAALQTARRIPPRDDAT